MKVSKIAIDGSFYNKLTHLDEFALNGVKERLEDIARTAVEYSPVDTGAYVTSFSYAVGAGRPRGKSSDNLPNNANRQGKQQEGYENLMQDVSRIQDLDTFNQITLRNGSPHAVDVEYGEKWFRDGYHVFAKIRNIYG
jgi:hypothetical protein|tara:strand:+ start:1055 stop:1468 length:414 start_codon:yes stop_codon:yes gene_type:complete